MYLDISLDLYRIFCMVVDSGNMSATAKELGVTQPAISSSIRLLENKLGKELLVRYSKGVRPTPEGKMLYRHLKEALIIIEGAEKKFTEMLNLESGEIRIGANNTIITQYLSPIIKDYFEAYPNIDIKVCNRTTDQTIKLLLNGEIDIGFINLPTDNVDHLEVLKYIVFSDCIVGGSKYSFLASKGIMLKELTEYPLILLEEGNNSRQILDNYVESQNVVLTPSIEVSTDEQLIMFCKMNLGLTIIAKELLQCEINDVSLFEIPVDPVFPKRSIGIVKLKNATLSNAAETFIKKIIDSTAI